MVIDNNGNVGINDTSPDGELDIISNASPSGYIVSVSSQNDTTGNILSILGNGNVGIGTTSPKAKLQVGNTLTEGEKSIAINDTWATVLSVNLGGDHKSAFLEVWYGGVDWGSHSSPSFHVTAYLKDGSGSYGEPGRIRDSDYWEPTSNDYIEAQLIMVDASTVGLQLRTNAAGDGFVGGTNTTTQTLTYRLMGSFTAIN